MTTAPTAPLPPPSVRQQIVAAARDEFAARGQRAASVRAIARRAGVTAAMINYYFGGKGALYDAVVAEAQGRLGARLAAALGDGERPGLAPRLAGAYFDFLVEERQLQSILLREVLDRGAGAAALGRGFVAPLRGLLKRHFGRRRAALQAAISLFGAVAGYFLYAPVLGELLGADPLGPGSLARRRRHLLRLASLIEELKP